MKSTFFLAYLGLCCVSLYAQQELGLYLMSDNWQSQMVQPANFSQKKVSIALPSVAYNLSNSGFALNTLLSKTSDAIVINGNPSIDNLHEKNYLRANAAINPIALGIRLNNVQLGLSTSLKSNIYADYSKEMLGLLFHGNSNYIGQSVNMGANVNASAYSETALSLAYRFVKSKRVNDGYWSIGVKMKYLNGLANVSTSPYHQQASIYTDREIYAVTLKTDYILRSSVLGNNDISTFKLNDYTPSLIGENHGWGLDIGTVYRVNSKWTIGASIIDIGKIRWVENAKSYQSQGEYDFKGVSFNEVVTNNANTSLATVKDTLTTLFKFKAIDNTPYTTYLPTQFYASVTYQPRSFIRFGGLAYGEWYYKKWNPCAALSANINGKWFSIGAIGAYRNGRIDNLGVNAILKYHALELYFVSDNILGMLSPASAQNNNLRTGMNLTF